MLGKQEKIKLAVSVLGINRHGGKFLSASLLLIAGCTVGPDYTPPSPPDVKNYTGDFVTGTIASEGPSGTAQQFAYGRELEAEWWHLFQSPQIDTVVKQALQGNPDLAAAKASLRQAHEAVAAASGALFPQVDASAGLSHQKTSFVQFGENMAIPSFALYSLGGTVQYPLDIFGTNKRTVEEQQALEDVERDELAAAYVMLTGQAVSQSITIAVTRDEIRAVDDIIASDQENLRLLNNAVQGGVLAGKGPEVLSAESQLESDRNLRPPLLQQLDMAKHALTALTGQLPAQWSPPDFALSNIALPIALPVSLPSAFVAQRPDIRAADAQLHAASAAIGIASANMLPNVTLSGAWTYNALQLKDLFSPVGIVNSIGGQLAAPIFHGGTLEAQKKAAEAAYDVAQAQYQKTVVQAFQQVADVLRALEHDAELTQSQQRSVAAATRALDSARSNLSRGTNGYLQVLDATRLYNESLVGYVRAVSQRYQDTAQLFVALGGGWWRDPNFPAGQQTEEKTVAQQQALPSVEVYQP